jgi:hypothetical protein
MVDLNPVILPVYDYFLHYRLFCRMKSPVVLKSRTTLAGLAAARRQL